MNTRLPALLASVANSTRRVLLPGRRPASLSAAAQRTSLHTAPKQQQESRLVGLLEPYWDAAMGVHISSIVAGLAGGVGLAAWSLRHVLPLPLSVVLWHVAGTGMLVAAAATETMAGQTTGLLGKVRRAVACGRGRRRRRPVLAWRVQQCVAVRQAPWLTLPCLPPCRLQRADGTIGPVSFTLLWPYHAGLRAKLALQRRVSSEPSFSQVRVYWCVANCRAAAAWPAKNTCCMLRLPLLHNVHMSCGRAAYVAQAAGDRAHVWACFKHCHVASCCSCLNPSLPASLPLATSLLLTTDHRALLHWRLAQRAEAGAHGEGRAGCCLSHDAMLPWHSFAAKLACAATYSGAAA